MRVIIFLMCLFLSQVSTAAQKKHHLENLAVLIPSCDKYAEAWPGFFKLLDKYWPQLDNKIYLIGGHKKFERKNLYNISIVNEKSWSDNVLQVLNIIEEDYVMIFLEDYYITKPVNQENLIRYYEIMKQEGAANLVLAPGEYLNKHPVEKGLAYMKPEQPYRTSLQAVIWKKDILKKLLKSGESPWEFELVGTVRTHGMKEPFMISTDKPIPYSGVIRKGHWWRDIDSLIEKEGIVLDRKLPKESFFREKYIEIMGWISVNINQPIKRFFGLEHKTLTTGWF